MEITANDFRFTQKKRCFTQNTFIDDSRLNFYGGCIDGGANGGGIEVCNNGNAAGSAYIYGGTVQTRENCCVWLHDNGSFLSVYGGELSTSSFYTICVMDDYCRACVYGGKISGSSDNYYTIEVNGTGASLDISGGEIIGEKKFAVDCTRGTVEIKDGEVKSENTTGICIYNNDTLVISGGTVSCNGYYGIYNIVDYNNGEVSHGITTISGGIINSAGDAIYNGEESTVEIKGGKINSEKYYGIENYGTLKISDGEIKAKGDYALYNLSGGLTEMDGGKLAGGSVCVWNNGTLNVSGGEILSDMNPVVNHGSLDISGGKWGRPESDNYIKNAKNMKLSGSPSFINTTIWLTTDDNIEIAGELTCSDPCPIYADSGVPRIFTHDRSSYMSGKAPSDYFKGTYSYLTVAKSEGGEALLRAIEVTFDANGGTCNTARASVDSNRKIPSLPAAAYGEYPFEGWYTEKKGDEKITTDTVFDGDTTVYAHYIGYEATDGSISMEVRQEDNAPDTRLNDSLDELAKAVLTPEEQEAIKQGTDIKIILIVSDASKTVPTADKEKVEVAINELDGYKLGQYLDLNLLKIIGSSEGVKITQTNKPIRIRFEIPKELRGKTKYSVIRVHNGTATVLPDLDSDSNTVTIETDKFSTYALTYQDKPAPSDPSGGNTNGGNTSSETNSGASSNTSSDTSTPSETSSNASSETSSDTLSETSSVTSGAASSTESVKAPSGSNPNTGYAISIIPLAAVSAMFLTVAAKRKK